MMSFAFLEQLTEQNLSINSNTILSPVDTRQTNREKVIAESYWLEVFDEEKQNKT
jgi:hypothetical protein